MYSLESDPLLLYKGEFSLPVLHFLTPFMCVCSYPELAGCIA
jgi:hypothetical protein